MMFLQGSVIKMFGVEVTRAGQFGMLGRYPGRHISVSLPSHLSDSFSHVW